MPRMTRLTCARQLKCGAIGLMFIFSLGVHQTGLAKTLARVNGVEITENDLKLAAEDLGPKLPRQLQGKARESFLLNYLIDRRLVAQAAEARNIADSPEFAERFAFLRDKAFFETMIGQVARNASTEDAIKAAYEELTEKQRPETEYHIQQIVFATEDGAWAAHKRLAEGADFSKILGEASKENALNGGDLGWVSKEFLAAQFGDAVASLEPGRLSEPLKTPSSWAIVKLEEKRPKTLPPLEQIRIQVQRYVEQKAQSEFIARLRESAKIDFEQAPSAQQQ